MKYEEIAVSVLNDSKITKEEELFLKNIYEKFFIELYGDDYNTYLHLALHGSKLYRRSLNVLESIQENNNIRLLKITMAEKLIGFGRIVIDINKMAVPEIVLNNFTKEEEASIYEMIIEQIIAYGKLIGIKKLAIEVPKDKVRILARMQTKWGFSENPEDIEITNKNYTYYLTKDIE